MRGYPPFMASLRITSVVRPLQEETVEQARPLVRTLFLAVAVVLLIACANLAGLLLVRAIRRQREGAIRQALGAPASALLRPAFLESLILSVSGGALGVLLAAMALRVGKSLLPESLPRIDEIGLNWKVIGFALLLGIVTGLLCDWAPAFTLRTGVTRFEKRAGQRRRGRKTCSSALHPRGGGNRGRPRSAGGLGAAAAQLREDALHRARLPPPERHFGVVFTAAKAIRKAVRRG